MALQVERFERWLPTLAIACPLLASLVSSVYSHPMMKSPYILIPLMGGLGAFAA
jgi:hypothetical protein